MSQSSCTKDKNLTYVLAITKQIVITYIIKSKSVMHFNNDLSKVEFFNIIHTFRVIWFL